MMTRVSYQKKMHFVENTIRVLNADLKDAQRDSALYYALIAARETQERLKTIYARLIENENWSATAGGL